MSMSLPLMARVVRGEMASSAHSPPIAMRVLAALLTLACSCQLHAQPHPFTPLVSSILSGNHRVQRALNCAAQLGPIKCLNAFSVWRAERALKKIQQPNAQFNLMTDLERFPWKQYNNVSDEQVYSQLCEGTERLLKRRSLLLSVPGYRFELQSRGNGTLSVDVLRNTETAAESGRSSKKKLKKMFYKIAPFLVLPGLLMSAVLPFILPALKMMTIGAGLLNNMALTGAVFTLLRNNAFNDKYEHKILYVNAGYKNEKHAQHYEEGHHTNENDFVYADTNIEEHGDIKDSHTFSETFETIDESPGNWKNGFGDGKYYKIFGHKIERKGGKV